MVKEKIKSLIQKEKGEEKSENNKKKIILHTGPPFWYDGPFFIYTAAK